MVDPAGVEPFCEHFYRRKLKAIQRLSTSKKALKRKAGSGKNAFGYSDVASPASYGLLWQISVAFINLGRPGYQGSRDLQACGAARTPYPYLVPTYGLSHFKEQARVGASKPRLPNDTPVTRNRKPLCEIRDAFRRRRDPRSVFRGRPLLPFHICEYLGARFASFAIRAPWYSGAVTPRFRTRIL